MKFAIFILFISATAVQNVNAMSNAEVAKEIAALYSALKSPDDAIKILKENTPQSEQSLINELAVTAKRLPQIKAQGATLQITLGNKVENLNVIDGSKVLFEMHGVELDLSSQRPLKDRLSQIRSLLGDHDSAAFWLWLLPQAAAGDDVDSYRLWIVTMGKMDEEIALSHMHTEVGSAARKLLNVCEAKKVNPDERLPGQSFPNDINRQVSQGSWAKKNPLKPEAVPWVNMAAYLEDGRVLSKYCGERTWTQYLSGNYKKTYACRDIKKASACLRSLEEKKATLYKPQYDTMIGWLKDVTPDEIGADQLANAVNLNRTQTAVVPNGQGARR